MSSGSRTTKTYKTYSLNTPSAQQTQNISFNTDTGVSPMNTYQLISKGSAPQTEFTSTGYSTGYFLDITSRENTQGGVNYFLELFNVIEPKTSGSLAESQIKIDSQGNVVNPIKINLPYSPEIPIPLPDGITPVSFELDTPVGINIYLFIANKSNQLVTPNNQDLNNVIISDLNNPLFIAVDFDSSISYDAYVVTTTGVEYYVLSEITTLIAFSGQQYTIQANYGVQTPPNFPFYVANYVSVTESETIPYGAYLTVQSTSKGSYEKFGTN